MDKYNSNNEEYDLPPIPGMEEEIGEPKWKVQEMSKTEKKGSSDSKTKDTKEKSVESAEKNKKIKEHKNEEKKKEDNDYDYDTEYKMSCRGIASVLSSLGGEKEAEKEDDDTNQADTPVLDITDVIDPGAFPTRFKGDRLNLVCEVCNIELNSDIMMETHLNGIKHRKKEAIYYRRLRETQGEDAVTKDDVVKLSKMGKLHEELDKSIPPCIVLDPEAISKSGKNQGLVCTICDVKLSSIGIIKSHLDGLKHMEKEAAVRHQMEVEGKFPSEIKTAAKSSIPLKSGHKSYVGDLHRLLEKSTNPVIGLQFIEEYIADTLGVPPIYRCSLCGAESNDVAMYNHVIGHKHRSKVIERLCNIMSGFLTKGECMQQALDIERQEGRNLRLIRIIKGNETFPWQNKKGRFIPPPRIDDPRGPMMGMPLGGGPMADFGPDIRPMGPTPGMPPYGIPVPRFVQGAPLGIHPEPRPMGPQPGAFRMRGPRPGFIPPLMSIVPDPGIIPDAHGNQAVAVSSQPVLYEEIRTFNRNLASSAMNKAMTDVNNGHYAQANKTLDEVISNIRQSKVGGEEEAQKLVRSLQDVQQKIKTTEQKWNTIKQPKGHNKGAGRPAQKMPIPPNPPNLSSAEPQGYPMMHGQNARKRDASFEREMGTDKRPRMPDYSREADYPMNPQYMLNTMFDTIDNPEFDREEMVDPHGRPDRYKRWDDDDRSGDVRKRWRNVARGRSRSVSPDDLYRRYPDSLYRRRQDSPYSRRPDSPYGRRPDSPYDRRPDSPYGRRPDSPYRRRPGSPYERHSDNMFERYSDSPFERYPRSPRRRPDSPYRRQYSPYRRQDSPYRRLSVSPYRRQPDNVHRRRSKSPHRRQPNVPYKKQPNVPYRRGGGINRKRQRGPGAEHGRDVAAPGETKQAADELPGKAHKPAVNKAPAVSNASNNSEPSAEVPSTPQQAPPPPQLFPVSYPPLSAYPSFT